MTLTTGEAQTKARLDHLWRLSHATVSSVPGLSVHYQETFHRAAAADRQVLADAVQRRCCTHCGVPRVPSHTSRVRIKQRSSKARPRPSTAAVAGKRSTDMAKRQCTRTMPRLHYIGRPLEQRPAGQRTRLRSARDVEVACLVCGNVARYGGTTRAELDKVGASATTTPMPKQARKAASSAGAQSKSIAAPSQTSRQTGVLSSEAARASSGASKSLGPAKKQPASRPAGQPSTGTKRDKKAGKKHALSKLLDKGRQRRSEDNAPTKNLSLNDFLMDFGQ